jgi:hypothetical protein
MPIAISEIRHLPVIFEKALLYLFTEPGIHIS